NRKEFRLIGRSIVAQKGVAIFTDISLQLAEFSGHDRVPALALFGIGKVWGSVHVTIQEIELVRKLVDNHIAAKRRVSTLGKNATPGENHRSAINRLPIHY